MSQRTRFVKLIDSNGRERHLRTDSITELRIDKNTVQIAYGCSSLPAFLCSLATIEIILAAIAEAESEEPTTREGTFIIPVDKWFAMKERAEKAEARVKELEKQLTGAGVHAVQLKKALDEALYKHKACVHGECRIMEAHMANTMLDIMNKSRAERAESRVAELETTVALLRAEVQDNEVGELTTITKLRAQLSALRKGMPHHSSIAYFLSHVRDCFKDKRFYADTQSDMNSVYCWLEKLANEGVAK